MLRIKFTTNIEINRQGFDGTVEVAEKDEEVAEEKESDVGWTCANGNVITDKSLTCDGHRDCLDGSDESRHFADCIGTFRYFQK